LASLDLAGVFVTVSAWLRANQLKNDLLGRLLVLPADKAKRPI
ncbi:MAG: hypothetical protein RL319_765, partial [Actinomycetota bacterium]